MPADIQKKFRIDGLDTKLRYKSAARIILKSKLRTIHDQIDNYLKDDSTENLHAMRIAFRRLRYVMEIFSECYEPKLFNKVYNKVKKLQDLIGEGRDLDVLEMKIRNVEQEVHKKMPKYFYHKIEEEKKQIRYAIKMEMINFIVNKDVNRIFK